MKKPHPLAGKKQSPETIAKRIATMKAKRAMREATPVTAVVVRPRKNAMPVPELSDISDAIHTLRRLRKIARRDNPDVEDMALLGMLALRMLEGGLK